jgi:hypothetical protein
MLQGPHNDIPERTQISVQPTADSCNCVMYVWHQIKTATGGWEKSLPAEGWEADGAGAAVDHR